MLAALMPHWLSPGGFYNTLLRREGLQTVGRDHPKAVLDPMDKDTRRARRWGTATTPWSGSRRWRRRPVP